MPQLRCELSSDFANVTQRRLGRRAFFEDDDDKRRYLDTLKCMMGEYDASILAWTLMTNHVHLLINEQDGFARIDGYRPRICDSDARAIAQRYFGTEFSDHIVGLPKLERDKALRLLKDIGLSIWQIERLTGIGRGIITKA